MKHYIFLLFLTLLGHSFVNAEEVTINGINYDLDETLNTAKVSPAESKYSGDITIPSSVEYNGNVYTVTSIGMRAFRDCTELQSIVIPNSVKILDDYSFYRCSGLTNVSLGNSVEDIKESSFALCTQLRTIEIPGSVKNLGHDAFASCGNLESITLNEGLISISGGVFYDCGKLESISIPNSVESIGYMAFSFSGISSVNIPTSLTYIESRSFDNCYNIKTIVIPNGVTSLGIMAFYHCSNLTSVTIPYTVNSIGRGCFEGCENLLHLYCYNDKTPTIYENTFGGGAYGATLHIPETAMNEYKTVEYWNKFNKYVSLPNYILQYIVDGNIYKTYKYEENRPIVPEPDPIKEGYKFSGWSEIPATMPARDVTVSGTFTMVPLGKCATPTIGIMDGKLHFDCDTPDVTFYYDVTPLGMTSGNGNDVELANTYKVIVYATKERYEDSEKVTKEIKLSTGPDLNKDGLVNAADVVKLVNIIASQ